MDLALDALGEPTRRRILELLAAGGEQPAGAVVEALRADAQISQPAVSQHLRVLRDAGLVTVRAAGARRFYALDPAGIEAAQDWFTRLARAARETATSRAVDPAAVPADPVAVSGVPVVVPGEPVESAACDADQLGQFVQPLDALATEIARGRRARRSGPIAGPAPRPAERPGA
ncbi:DNA-binding transcriptional regulator, ArsR family [Parafrankia irregularis]|uniref:DNA-binding transcriptional regulator, ArsR family n=1 Tax=Parafrankia irregularis TaxID=795642 RepID=A0A0S4QGZ1_9ACTN|nr:MULTISPECIES: metalloregulator ArsR/SmtB family transcription factor [Parafrankia]MBE3203329.1 winged helix-turn-helix transcriptional regulator [Parafrankia sp. CH37]CUU54024.1 DNA-binding transcriptional regulator, ArsR family [Parafrankia irregularis]